MRFRYLILLGCALLSAVPELQADTIFLKNGRRLVVDTAQEINGQIKCGIGDDSYSIPKSLVDHIETGAKAVSLNSSSKEPKEDVTDFVPHETMAAAEDLSIKIVRDGRVDTELLAALDQAGNVENAAAGYFAAARYETEHSHRDKALIYLRRALAYEPENTTLLNHYAALLVQMERPAEALGYAEHSVRLAPASADGLTVLGFAYFGSDRTKDALRVWKKSLLIRPDAVVDKFVARAAREVNTEADYAQRDSGHFTLKYEGKKVSDELGRSVLDTLERHYDDLVRQLGVTPRANIGVVLYTEQAFFDVAQSPSWTGALNDGKLRLPIEGVTAMNPELSRVLKHELAHSFITQVSRGRCPHWLHEGIAQLVEGRTTAGFGRALSRLYGAEHQVRLNLLESSFMKFRRRSFHRGCVAADYPFRIQRPRTGYRSLFERQIWGMSPALPL